MFACWQTRRLSSKSVNERNGDISPLGAISSISRAVVNGAAGELPSHEVNQHWPLACILAWLLLAMVPSQIEAWES